MTEESKELPTEGHVVQVVPEGQEDAKPIKVQIVPSDEEKLLQELLARHAQHTQVEIFVVGLIQALIIGFVIGIAYYIFSEFIPDVMAIPVSHGSPY